MKKLTFTNSRNEVLSLPSTDLLYLKNLQGFKEYTVSTTQDTIPFRQGAITTSLVMGPRSLAFDIYVFAEDGTEYEAEKETARIRDILNPFLGEGTLTIDTGYRTRKINAFVVDVDPTDETDLFGHHIIGVTMQADDPFFNDLVQEVYVLSGTADPFEFPSGSGAEFGFEYPSESKIVEINNTGDYITPLNMVIAGPVDNPVITKRTIDSLGNVETVEYMKFNVSIVSGETLTINTEQAREQVYITRSNGDTEDVIFSMDEDPIYDYFQLDIGKNIIDVTDDNGVVTTLSISYNNRYVTI